MVGKHIDLLECVSPTSVNKLTRNGRHARRLVANNPWSCVRPEPKWGQPHAAPRTPISVAPGSLCRQGDIEDRVVDIAGTLLPGDRTELGFTTQLERWDFR